MRINLKSQRRRKKSNPEGRMSLGDHVRELRYRVLLSLGIIVAGTIIGFIWYNTTLSFTFHTTRLFYLPSLGDILLEPYCRVPADRRLQMGSDAASSCRLLATSPLEAFMLRLKIGSLAGVLITSPFWLYQVWSFLAPGLYKKERRYAGTFVVTASLLFLAGAVLAYFVVAEALDFLLSVGDNVQITALSGGEYFSFILALIIIFGISFELPLFIVTLNFIGIVSYKQLSKWRRGLIVGLACLAAVITPGGDPISMTALMLSLMVLQEFAIQVTRIHDRRRARKQPDWLNVDDDAASPLEPVSRDPSTSDYVAPVVRPSVIEPSDIEPSDIEPDDRQAIDRHGQTTAHADDNQPHGTSSSTPSDGRFDDVL